MNPNIGTVYTLTAVISIVVYPHGISQDIGLWTRKLRLGFDILPNTFDTFSLVTPWYSDWFQLLMDPLVLSVLYVWCQVNKDTIVQFWFGMQFKAMYLPWVLAIFNMIIQGGGVMELIGIFVGHVYFFLMFKYPQDFGGARLLSTPSFFYKYLPNRQGGVRGFGVAPASRRPRDDGNDGGGGVWGRSWGRGRRLDE